MLNYFRKSEKIDEDDRLPAIVGWALLIGVVLVIAVVLTLFVRSLDLSGL